MTDNAARQPHAVLDLDSRRWKALKIERLLELDRRPGPLKLLEVGTGSGGIAHYFGTHPSGRFDVDAVDVVDNRLVTEGYRYTAVTDVRLPFPDDSFDVVLSNHVIEHVGDAAQQRAHLAELKRVMRPDGIGYLAVPNRWMLVEPHYRLIFLSWLPRRWRSPYLRLSGKGSVYDCEPLQSGQLDQLLRESGFTSDDLGPAALKQTFLIERQGRMMTRVVSAIPDVVVGVFARVIPTLIRQFHHSPLTRSC
jgi:SAM-dependent methyltransferase